MLAIGKDYNYSSGTFGSGTGTVVYNGTGSQQIASITYNNLTINKTSGIAKLSGTSIINNALLSTMAHWILAHPQQ
jgi:hypothetical protein